MQCATVNTQVIHELCLQSDIQEGDTLTGAIEVWTIPKEELHLYIQQVAPVSDSRYTPTKQRIRLDMYNEYLWMNSSIHGHACIVNNATTASIASLYIFTNVTDASDFMANRTQVTPNDTIVVEPDGNEHCFKKWDQDNPLIVNQSAYYAFFVDVPANSTYNWSIAISQAHVNTSKYGTPRYLTKKNTTCYRFMNETKEMYVGICKAPSFLQLRSSPGLDAESIHVLSCSTFSEQKSEMSQMYTVIMTGVAAVTVILLYVLFVFVIYFMYNLCWQCNKRES